MWWGDSSYTILFSLDRWSGKQIFHACAQTNSYFCCLCTVSCTLRWNIIHNTLIGGHCCNCIGNGWTMACPDGKCFLLWGWLTQAAEAPETCGTLMTSKSLMVMPQTTMGQHSSAHKTRNRKDTKPSLPSMHLSKGNETQLSHQKQRRSSKSQKWQYCRYLNG